jgi:hypothetical protein
MTPSKPSNDRNQRTAERLVGAVSIDSGTLILVDPGALREGFASRDFELGGDLFNLSYMEAGQEALGYGGKGQLTDERGFPTGFITSTGIGDGVYPVYAVMDGDRVLSICVDFTEEADPSKIDATPVEEIKRRRGSAIRRAQTNQ